MFTSIPRQGVRVVMQVGGVTAAAHAAAPGRLFVNNVSPGATVFATYRSGLPSPFMSPNPTPRGRVPGTQLVGAQVPQGEPTGAVLPKQPSPLPRKIRSPSPVPWLSSTTPKSGSLSRFISPPTTPGGRAPTPGISSPLPAPQPPCRQGAVPRNPSPFPKRIEMTGVPLTPPLFETTTSGLKSPFMSAAAAATGFAPIV